MKKEGGWLRRRRKWLIALGILLLLLLLGFCAFSGEAPAMVETETVDRGDVVASIAASGKVRARNTVEVGAEVSGQVAEVAVDFNTQVRRGDVLARIDPTRLRAQVGQGEAQVALANAQLDQARAQARRARAGVTLQQAEYERRQALEGRGFVTGAALDQIAAARDQARADLSQAEAQIQTAQAQRRQAQAIVDSARLDLSRTILRAPIDGIVISRSIDPGQTVVSSFQTATLFEIAEDLSRMRVEANVDEADIGRIRVGQPVRFTVDAYPGDVFTGTVEQVRKAPTEQQNIVTYLVLLTVENEAGKLLPGMTATVDIITGRAKDVLRVPTAALRYTPLGAEDSEGARVWREGEDGPEAVAVEIGLEGERHAELTGGPLRPGDEVIVRAVTTPSADEQ